MFLKHFFPSLKLQYQLLWELQSHPIELPCVRPVRMMQHPGQATSDSSQPPPHLPALPDRNSELGALLQACPSPISSLQSSQGSPKAWMRSCHFPLNLSGDPWTLHSHQWHSGLLTWPWSPLQLLPSHSPSPSLSKPQDGEELRVSPISQATFCSHIFTHNSSATPLTIYPTYEPVFMSLLRCHLWEAFSAQLSCPNFM